MADFNISQDNVSGECNLKCSYSFQYSNSTCVANNTGNAIILSYDESNVPPVTYNGNKYKVSGVSISASSYFLFNGKQPKGTINITHTPIVGGTRFSVMIPIVSGNSSMPSSNILTNIINETANLAPKSGNKSVISVENYNLNNIVPKKPFYSFNWPDPGGGTETIVYGIENAITIDADTIAKEIEIAKDLLRQEGKPEAMLDNIAKGKLARFFKDNTLVNQDYIKDNKMSVAAYVKSLDKDLIVTGFKRAALG